MDASEQITGYIAGLTDWRGETIARIRELTLQAAADLTEEWKWKSPVWSRNGMVCSAGAMKSHVSISFFQGASLEDPNSLFNSSLDAKGMRTIKLQKGDSLDESGYQDLVRAGVAHNTES